MFNNEAFLEDVKKVHLKVDDTLSGIPLQGFTDDDKSLISKALDDICNNIVGNTMFMLLMTKKPPGQRLRIIDIGPEEATKPLVMQEGSSYRNGEVEINSNAYDQSGIGASDKQYYHVDERSNIIKGLKSLSGSIFHEFTHCLHDIEDSTRYFTYFHSPLPDGNYWYNKEERRTISGYIEADAYEAEDTYDPICDNCFHLYSSVSESIPHFAITAKHKRPILCRPTTAKQAICRQVMAKATPYRPRLGHIGYVKVNPSKAELQRFYRTLNFDLDWPTKYS
jgi:hypothetical protein